MTLPRPPEGEPAVLVELKEWQQVGPAQHPQLRGMRLPDAASARRSVEAVRDRIDLRETYDGLEVTSTSFVGQVDVGPIRILIRPKLPALQLSPLLRYAYGLRDLSLIGETHAQTVRHGLHDLLIAMLISEVTELLYRGLARRYVARSEWLESPRGRILLDDLVRQGGVLQARLPCRHFQRSADWHLNRVVRAGLELAGRMTLDRDLRRRTHRLSPLFEDVEPATDLHERDVDLAEQNVTRLTSAYAPALTIIRLLKDMQGTDLQSPDPRNRTQGYLFDMNRFFQRLLSRFLREHVANARIVDEFGIRNVFAYARDANPRRRTPPTPRPDFALIRGRTLTGFIDAKYRDIWEKGLPADWLYQLSIYALASPQHVSLILYASTSDDAREERVDIQTPLPLTGQDRASVIIRPVPLVQLADFLAFERMGTAAPERKRLAETLVAFRTLEFAQAAGRRPA